MPSPASNRRAFLTGQAAADALAELANRTVDAVGGPADNTPPARAAAYQVRFARRAMACQFEIVMNAGHYSGNSPAAAVALEALDLVEALEEQLTVYRETSELMSLNRGAASEALPVEARLFALLQLAVQIHAETGGAYDITAGPLTKVWGFYRRQGSFPAPTDLQAALKNVGTQYLQLDVQQQSLRFTQPGMEINLGSIGKGYALDRSAELLQSANIDDFLLQGGASSVLAHGNRVGTRGWPVALGDPLRPGKSWARLSLLNRAMGTSGSGWQFFRHQGRRYGHILDPRTGYPAEGVLSSTVLAPTAAEADALSTAFYVLGPALALEYCRHRADVAMLMLCPADGGHGSVVYQANVHGLDLEWLAEEPSTRSVAVQPVAVKPGENGQATGDP